MALGLSQKAILIFSSIEYWNPYIDSMMHWDKCYLEICDFTHIWHAAGLWFAQYLGVCIFAMYCGGRCCSQFFADQTDWLLMAFSSSFGPQTIVISEYQSTAMNNKASPSGSDQILEDIKQSGDI